MSKITLKEKAKDVIHADKSSTFKEEWFGERNTECGLLEHEHPNMKIKPYKEFESSREYWKGITCKRCLAV
jgi:hypothetical protein|tara:strand:- start:28 stop:240 length:213 start_codon:yes stop_codon:yes gene_type:complete